MDPEQRWALFPIGYALSVAMETPVLLIGLSPKFPFSARLFAGFWLTACTYPVVLLVLPGLFALPRQEILYACVAEVFAVLGEYGLFQLAFRSASRRDGIAIVLANAASCGLGMVLAQIRALS